MENFQLQHNPGRTTIIGKKEWLFFSGYAYLGILHHPEFIELVKEGIDKYGWIFPSSRISNTRLLLFEEFENYLAALTGFEDCLVLSSGFLAGELATSSKKEQIKNLVPSHPAISVKNFGNNSNTIAFNSVDIFNSQIILPENNLLENSENIMVDDSHGFGLLGNSGEGYSTKIDGRYRGKYQLCFSLSKAWNINAGAILGKKSSLQKLRSNPIYTSSTSPSPALLFAAINAQEIFRKQLQKLRNNIIYLQLLLQGLNVRSNKELPIFILPENFREEKLREHHIIISSFPYPNPKGKKVNRIIVNALHTKADLENLAVAIRESIF